jgi:hypothetical protein
VIASPAILDPQKIIPQTKRRAGVSPRGAPCCTPLINNHAL